MDAERIGDETLSAIAKKRRADAESIAETYSGSIIQSVDRSTVTYTFTPLAIPYQQVDYAAVDEALMNLYKITRKNPDFSPLLREMTPQQLSNMGEGERFRSLLQNTNSQITWESGQYPLKNDFVEISFLSVNFESVKVAVKGQSQVAEVIVKEFMELLWQSTGIKKSYLDLSSKLQLRGFSTQTRLQLDSPIEDVLRPTFMDYLKENLAEGHRFAAHMGMVSNSERPVYATIAVDDLILRVATFDPQTGAGRTHRLSFRVTAASDYGTGRVVADSELPYDQHVKLVAGLFERS